MSFSIKGKDMKFIVTIFLLITLLGSTMAANKHPMKIAMVSVLVSDPAKAFKFYTEILGFEEVMFSPENYIAIVKSPLDSCGTTILLEPTEPGGLDFVQKYKSELYKMGMPVISFGCDDIQKTYEELKSKGVKFKLEPTKRDFGYEAIFDDDNGNYIQLLQMEL